MNTLTPRTRDYIFGDRKFYRAVVAILLPIIIQNGISSFVNLLDNIMIGQLGTYEMSGVSIANYLFFVYNIAVFGGISGASIYSAQFFGAKDYESMKCATRYKLYIGLFLFILCGTVFFAFGEPLLKIFMSENEEASALAQTLDSAKTYLLINIIGLLPFALSQAYSSALRDGGETVLPMISGVAAVVTNLVFNYILIFGNLGAPRMGVEGGAIATVLSRYVELGILVIFTHKNKVRYFFMSGLYKTLKIPGALVWRMTKRGFPLLLNEMLWSIGMSFLTQLYSMRGLNVVAAMNISNTVSNLFNTVLFAMGNAVAIMVGQALGADDHIRAKLTAWRLIYLNLMCCVVIGTALAVSSPFIPYIYNVDESVRSLATSLMLVLAASMPVLAVNHCAYFTMRSGGKTIITFIFDCVSTWVLNVPVAYVLIHFTGLNIIWVYAAVQAINIAKGIFGIVLVKNGVWINNITVSG